MEEQGWFKPTMDRLDGIARYPDLANEWKCRKVSGEALLMARGLLCRHMRAESSPPRIQPTDDGGILMEWHEYWVDLTVVVDPTGHFTAKLAVFGDPPVVYEKDADGTWDGLVERGFVLLDELRRNGPPPLPERAPAADGAARPSRKLNQD